jgi:hypothetical protein
MNLALVLFGCFAPVLVWLLVPLHDRARECRDALLDWAAIAIGFVLLLAFVYDDEEA